MPPGVIILRLYRHAMAIRRSSVRRRYWRNRDCKRWQSQRKQKYRKEKVTRHRAHLALFEFHLNIVIS